MTDPELQGLALQALNMAKRDILQKTWEGCLLASWHEGEQIHRMREIEQLINEDFGSDWLNHAEKKDLVFRTMRTFVQLSPPDAFIFVTATNQFMPTSKLLALPPEEIRRRHDWAHKYHHQAVREGWLELHDALLAMAQTPQMMCTYAQQISPQGDFLGQPKVDLMPQENIDGRMQMFGQAGPNTVARFYALAEGAPAMSPRIDNPEIGRELRVSELKPRSIVWLCNQSLNAMVTLWVIEVGDIHVHFRVGAVGVDYFALRTGPGLEAITDDSYTLKIFEYLGET